MVRAPGFVARVVGTVLRVVVDADGSSSIAVAHGAVEVVPLDGKPVLVHGGEHWPPRSTAAPTLEELGALPLDQREGVVLADFLPQVAKPTCAGDAASRLRCQLDLAQRAEADRAETALYEAGSIAWRELGDGKRALAIWRQQRQRFPNGVLRTEVQASIIDALVALRMLPEAETEIDRDLLADPEGLRTSEMHFVLGTIQRELDGDCRRARSQFSLALADPSGSAAARASEALRSCRRASHE